MAREKDGKWKKGQSANPGGRGREVFNLRDMCREYGDEAVTVVVGHMRGADQKLSLAAAKEILDRGFGKPIQQVTGPDGGPVTTAIQVTYAGLVDDTEPDAKG